jgi:uncharacterized protein YcfJ
MGWNNRIERTSNSLNRPTALKSQARGSSKGATCCRTMTRWRSQEVLLMYAFLTKALAAAGLAFAIEAAAQVTFYEYGGFEGRAFTTGEQIRNFSRIGFNDSASSVVVDRDRWEVCEDVSFSGRCVVLRPGRYASLASLGLDNRISSVRRVRQDEYVSENRYAPPPVAIAPSDVPAQVTFFEYEGFDGRSFTTVDPIANLERFGFNNRASSAVVRRDQWLACEDVRFDGRCVILRPGRYASLASMGLNNSISSVRRLSTSDRISDYRYAPSPSPVAAYDFNRRPDERLYEAPVTSVRAVVGPPGQRCWVEREHIAYDQREANVPGAIAGALIGGIIGHQVGSGRGNDVATLAGAIGGAVLGSNVTQDRYGRRIVTQDVQRCTGASSRARPDYWDVSYRFRGEEHRVQLRSPPGGTVTVNEMGEPRE